MYLEEYVRKDIQPLFLRKLSPKYAISQNDYTLKCQKWSKNFESYLYYCRKQVLFQLVLHVFLVYLCSIHTDTLDKVLPLPIYLKYMHSNKRMYTWSFFYVHFFYGHFFYGLKDLDRKKRKKTVKEGIGCVKVKVPTIPATITSTCFYGHFFYGPTFSLHTRP